MSSCENIAGKCPMYSQMGHVNDVSYMRLRWNIFVDIQQKGSHTCGRRRQGAQLGKTTRFESYRYICAMSWLLHDAPAAFTICERQTPEMFWSSCPKKALVILLPHTCLCLSHFGSLPNPLPSAHKISITASSWVVKCHFLQQPGCWHGQCLHRKPTFTVGPNKSISLFTWACV